MNPTDGDHPTPRRRLVVELTALLLRAEHRSGRTLDRPELARRLNISAGSLYAYLNGTTVPRGPVFERLVTALGATGVEVGRLCTLRDAAEIDQRTRRGGRTRGREPARPAESRPTPRQLPPITAHFVGRGAELDRLDGLLDAATGDGIALITAIDGAPGIGKTTLAVWWAHRVAHRYPDGQLYVNLRGFDVRTPMTAGQALHGLLHSLGVAPTAIPPDQDTKSALLRTLLSDRRVLLLLDNARSAEHVRPLLPATSSCLVIVTSRTRLDSLIVREGARRVGLDVMTHADASDLLSRYVTPERLAGNPEATDDLIALCAGLPLALSIVAARVASHPAEPLRAFVGELGEARERLDFLGLDEPDLDLRSVFHWSYTVLADDVARMFRLLGVHPGPSVDGYACAALSGARAVPRPELTTLVSAHLVTERRAGRFGMHDLIRRYAAERAEEADAEERHSALLRLLDHYVSAAEAANDRIQPNGVTAAPRATPTWPLPPIADYVEAMEWFTTELPTLHAVIVQAAAEGFESHAWRLAWACTVFLRRSGRRTERVTVHRLALDAAQRAGDRTAYATTLRLLADALARIGRRADALDLLHTSLAECHVLGDDDGRRQAHLSLVRIHEAEGRYAEALRDAETAYRLAGGKDLLAQADGLTAMSKQTCLLNQPVEAMLLGQRALALYWRLGHVEGQADVLMNVGLSQQRLGRYAGSIASYTRSLELDRLLGDRYWEAHALDNLADAHLLIDDEEQSRAYRLEALGILEALHHPDADTIRGKLLGVHQR